MNEEKMDGKSLDIAEEKRKMLKELFPEVFTEGSKIDFDRLKLTLGEDVDVGKERYGMNWPGKADCFKTIKAPSTGTLLPCREESEDFDNTENLFIEGDNLEVLKILQKSYLGKIKMIYIDPPYNTGNDFIYPDNYTETLDTYLEYTGQVDEHGRRFSTNQDTDGRFHSKWMNMMYPRLFLARNLLKEDGVIFISIDDNEVDNLKKICNEIFGEENFLANIIWEKRFTRSNNAKTFATLTEHILCYRKSSSLTEIKEPRNEKADSIYSNPDNDFRGVWTSVSYINPATKTQRPNLSYDLVNPYSGQIVTHPTNAWKYEKSTYDTHVAEDRLYWGQNGNNTYPRLKKFLSEMAGGMVPVNFWSRKDTGTTDEASKTLENIMGGKFFDFPKPHTLIKRAISIIAKPDDIILDFFSGSCTTAHAVLDFNKENGGHRKFIMVQLPEPCYENSEAYKAGFKTIADIGKARIRKVIDKIKDEKSQPSVDSLMNEEKTQDLGFKVFKLSTSNFKKWNKTTEDSEADIIKSLDEMLDSKVEGRTSEDILYEILIKNGISPVTKIEKLELAGKSVFVVFNNGMVLICLEDNLTREVIDAMADMNPSKVICLDSAFEGKDELKTNAVLTMKAKDVTKFITV